MATTIQGGEWIIKEGSIEQVGCIHTSQGLELDYVGVIVGPVGGRLMGLVNEEGTTTGRKEEENFRETNERQIDARRRRGR